MQRAVAESRSTKHWQTKGGECERQPPFFLVTIICRYQINAGVERPGLVERLCERANKCWQNKILLPNNIRGRSLLLLNSAALLRNDPGKLRPPEPLRCSTGFAFGPPRIPRSFFCPEFFFFFLREYFSRHRLFP